MYPSSSSASSSSWAARPVRSIKTAIKTAVVALAAMPLGIVLLALGSAPAAAAVFEAEDATLSQAAVATNHSGFTGSGFADYAIGAGSYVEWTVGSSTNATVSVAIRYSNGSAVNRPMDLVVNGTTALSSVAFNPTGSWERWATVYVTLPLVAGSNKIRAVALAAAGGPNVDSLSAEVSGGDVTPPSAPTNARASNLSCDAVTFAWNAAGDNVGVVAYDVFHDGQLIQSVGGGTLSTSFAVVQNVTWGLYVQARDAAGNVSQASSPTVSITPPACSDRTPPTTPGALSGSVSGTTISLRWTGSTDNVAVVAYEIYRNGALAGQVTGTAAQPPDSSFVDAGLAANTAYAYYVQARDGAGNRSGASNTVSVTSGAACASVCSAKAVATETDLPWGLVTLPDGAILYSRRDAHDIVYFNPRTGAKRSIGTVPNTQSTEGEGGLMGLEINPKTFSTDGWLYVFRTTSTDNRIARFKIDLATGTLNTGSEQLLLSGILRNKYHNGGRLRFSPDGQYLFAATGDAQNGAYAQDRNRLNGKILRIHPDGRIPSDNPFGNAVWSYGHRNPQGLAFDSQGRLWEQEFGNSVMDETNLIQKGGNYGWPMCEGTAAAAGDCAQSGLIAPKRTYPVASGSCSGITVIRDVLYVACERGARLYRHVINGTSLSDTQQFFIGTYGRLRTVEPSADGNLWMTTTSGDKDSTPNNSNDRIFQVVIH